MMMSNQYTEPSISGYNSSPPPDDGSSSSANELTWAKHKDKLGDPLKNYADAINSAITSAFAKNFLNSISTHSAGYTILAGDRGKLLDCSNTITIDLMAATTAGAGFAIAIRNAGSGVITIDGDGSETINGSATLVLQVNGWAILESDGSNWSALSFDGHYVTPVTGYSGGKTDYIVSDTTTLATTGFDVAGNLTTSTWETVGPTGSGADHIWADLDDIPTTAVALRVSGVISGSEASQPQNRSFHLGAADSGHTTGNTAAYMMIRDSFSTAANGTHQKLSPEQLVPLDSSNMFACYWYTDLSSPSAYFYLRGFIT